MTSIVARARAQFHQNLLQTGALSVNAGGIPSNADKGQRTSVQLAVGVIEQLASDAAPVNKLQGQTSGKLFEVAVAEFLEGTLPHFQSVRPGQWHIENVGGSRGRYHLASYEPYTHLDELARAVERDPTLTTVLGNTYNISPDVLVARFPVADEMINAALPVIDENTALRSPLRLVNQRFPIVHAVVSCKWTLRSDRAQNARSEALGIIRNRKGRAPHIAVVTGEPTPSRLSSLALGTGDIDTVYHFALPELIESAIELNNSEVLSTLDMLTSGNRLRDIADLPLDLVI